MTQKKWQVALGVVLTISLVGVLGASAALAQGTAPATPSPKAPIAKLPKDLPGGLALARGRDKVAELLGMTQAEIWAQRVLGKTLADLAGDKGVTSGSLVDAIVASQKTMLDQWLSAKRMTQAQADTYLAWYKQAAALQLTEPYGPGIGGGLGGFRGFGRPGAGRGGRGFGNGRGDWGGKMKSPAPAATPQA